MAGHGSAYLSSYLHSEVHIGGLWFRPAQGIKQNPISKITNTKRAWCMAQMVKRLSSKYMALSSNLPPTLKFSSVEIPN
jgi:hypothetical protein